MDRDVVWTHEAATDLKVLAEYIARDSVSYAAAFVREIRDAG
jgi:plasmid stabilization system protein ParE